jgi:hypothetical protein
VAIPSTSPTDFDGEEALKAIDMIESMHPERVALTHYGFIEKDLIPIVADQLRTGIRTSMEIVSEIRSGTLLPERVESELFSRIGAGLRSPDLGTFGIDLKVNAQGLIHAATKS